MSVNSITSGSTVAYQVQLVKSAGPADGTDTSAVAAKGQPATDQAEQAGAVASHTSTKTLTEKLPSPVAANGNGSHSAGVVSHVVVSYNQQGKMRTKFEDSRNNVVYQMPSEMAARLEDQIATSSTSANIKG